MRPGDVRVRRRRRGGRLRRSPAGAGRLARARGPAPRARRGAAPAAGAAAGRSHAAVRSIGGAPQAGLIQQIDLNATIGIAERISRARTRQSDEVIEVEADDVIL